MKSNILPWNVLSSRIVHSTQWLEVIEDTCEVNGTTIVYTYVKRVDEGPLIIPVTAEGKFWMVRQYRHPVKKILWQFPVEGKLKDESWEAAAQRGLQEELQLFARSLKQLGQYYPDPGSLDQQCVVFLAQDLQEVHTTYVPGQDEVEDLETAEFSRAEIDQMISQGEIVDSWTLSALYLYDRSLAK